MARYCFDIDGTICSTVGSDYPNSTPIATRIDLINRLYDAGNTIIFFTARGSTSGRDWKELTQMQLSTWGAKHHLLLMGKPAADVYIDDKGKSDFDFFSTLTF